MKYIITGGAGFIGSNLARTLSQDHKVTIIEKLPTSHVENTMNRVDRGDGSFVQGDINDTSLLQHTDRIYHQTTIPAIQCPVKNPVATQEAYL